MKLLIMSCALCLLIAANLAAVSSANTSTTSPQMPIPFTQNIGQWPDSILFRASGGEATLWFTRDGIYYQFSRSFDSPQSNSPEETDLPPHLRNREPDSVGTLMIKAALLGANPAVEIIPGDQLDYSYNYFIGNDPTQWHTDVPNFSGVIYENVYPGVDISFHSHSGSLACNIDADSPAALDQVQIDYLGADLVTRHADHSVSLNTPLGMKTFVGLLPQTPTSPSDWSMPVDAASPTAVQLAYSTYLGGNGSEQGYGIAVDAAGCAYVTGATTSTDFPTQSAYQTDQSLRDVLVSKFASNGYSLVYSTYLGGGADETGHAIAVNDAGFAFVAGYTASSNFPTLNPYQSDRPGGDAFVVRLATGGNSLIYSTYLGGSSDDYARGIDVMPLGLYATVVGYTYSSDFPTRLPYQENQPNVDAFITTLVPTGNDISQSTYLGGSLEDYAYGIAKDERYGQSYIIGNTSSVDFPTVNPYQSDQAGIDVFVCRMNGNGSSPMYSTYLGGADDEYGAAISLDTSRNAYVTGNTASVNFPILNPFQTNQPGSDAFVTKIPSSGGSITYSTYLGGNGDEYAWGIDVDLSGCAYVTAEVSSTDFPTVNPYQTDQLDKDAIVSKLSAAGNELVYSTYLGGSAIDYGNGIAVDAAGFSYIVGVTVSTDFPLQGPVQSDQTGTDVFVTKIAGSCCAVRGDLNHNGSVNVADLTYLVNYLFKAGAAPSCTEEGNVNNDAGDSINVADLTYLVNYLFKAGPAPTACD